MARQLAFDLPARPALGRADFLISPANQLAADLIEAEANWPEGRLVLIGPAGSGKSHLVQVWAGLGVGLGGGSGSVVGARGLTAASVPALAATGRVAVEDADRIAGTAAREAALFHLHNLVLAEGGRLLLTARRAPARWGLALPDLASRLSAAAQVAIAPPDDALLAAVLVKLFADRQIAVSPTLIPYLAARMERAFDAAGRLVAALDAASLAEGAPISRVLAGRVLDSLDAGRQ